jgi:zinc protease
VHTAVTGPAVSEFGLELVGIHEGVTPEELAFARSAMLAGMDRRFESTRALASYVDELTRYGYPDDFLLRRRATIETVTAAELKALARKHLDSHRRVVLVVGDKRRIVGDLMSGSYGDVFELDATGRPLGQIEYPLDGVAAPAKQE